MGPQTKYILIYILFHIVIRYYDALDNEKGNCNRPLGLGSGSIPDQSISAQTRSASASNGRLNKPNGAWCFSNESLQTREAVFSVDLGELRFISGFSSQGPPLDLKPMTYNHLVAFGAFSSRDNATWVEFDGGNLFFSVDKNDTADVISYHAATSIEFGRYVKLNVNLFVSGLEEICLRFEIYGCDSDVQPVSGIEATTTTMGKIRVRWKQPTVVNTLKQDSISQGLLTPNTHIITYWPLGGSKTTVSERKRDVLLDDVRLGATYVIELKCVFGESLVDCRSTQIEAYPPCPPDWTGGNEYHCFLLRPLEERESFEDVKNRCLDAAADILGPPGGLVDENEYKFVVSRILKESIREAWVVGEKCIRTEGNCCQLASVNQDNTLQFKSCGAVRPKFILCIRDHKGVGSRLRVSNVASSTDGSGVVINWRYEGDGWKTDELQMKLWSLDDLELGIAPTILTYSTLQNNFRVKDIQVEKMYNFLLKPAPNIRTVEKENGFIILELENETPKFAAFLTPVPVAVNILWSGYLRVTWDEVLARSESNTEKEGRPAEKYVVTSREMAAPNVVTNADVETAKNMKYLLTPVAMKAEYNFQLKCFFRNVDYLCSEIVFKTDPPALVRNLKNSCLVYDVIQLPKDWKSAEIDCNGRDGNLMSLLTEKEGKEVLDVFPNKDSLLWIGAKLGRKASGYWTDGTKITDLPMAKTSGVTSMAESCCRALNEADRLRLSGGDCMEKLSYICKYKLEKLLENPQPKANVKSWKSITVSWETPEKNWIPSFTEVSACPILDEDKEDLASCKVNEAIRVSRNIDFVTFDRLQEFMEYEVTVRGVLEDIQDETVKTMRIMTYPKSAVHYTITPEGTVTTKVAMLIAKGQPESQVTSILTDLEDQTDSGSVSMQGSSSLTTFDHLVPGRKYKLEVRDVEDFTASLEFEAVPTCSTGDTLWNGKCFKVVTKSSFPFKEATNFCEDGNTILWSPENFEEWKSVTYVLEYVEDYWLDANNMPRDHNFDGVCTSSDTPKCCKIESTKSSCKCCNEKSTFVCYYSVQAKLGKVQQLNTTAVTKSSIQLVWKPPVTLWNIPTYEVQWKGDGIEKKAITEEMQMTLQDLQPAKMYDISVFPYSTNEIRGDASTIKITTVDPRPELYARVTENGFVNLRSPRMVVKGMGTTPIEVKVYKNEQLILETSGNAEKSTFSGLKMDDEYSVNVIGTDNTGQRINYTMDFRLEPNCEENEEKMDKRCIWTPTEEIQTWQAADEFCKSAGGEIFGPNSKTGISTDCATLSTKFANNAWISVPSQTTEKENNIDVMKCENALDTSRVCCTCNKSVSNEIDCGCCKDSRYFMCQIIRKANFGEVGDIKVDKITSVSARLSWQVVKPSGWDESTFILNCESTELEPKPSKLVVRESPAMIEGLQPSSSYKVTVSPGYKDEPKGESREIVITTLYGDVMSAGYRDAVCTVSIFKITSCCAVILSALITVFVFLVTRMFYLDCLVHICSELALAVVYLCILISSSRSYDIDWMCSRTDPILCTATAVLIQYYFQVAYLFLMLEAMNIYQNLVQTESFLRSICTFLTSSNYGVIFCGWGVPALILIISASVASNEFTDRDENCWLNLKGKAMLPSIIPMVIFIFVHLIVMISLKFHITENKEDERLDNVETNDRKWIFARTKWISLWLLLFIVPSWLFGMFASAYKESALNYIFIIITYCLAIVLPILRIRYDGEVRQKLKNGLFTSFRETSATKSESGTVSKLSAMWHEKLKGQQAKIATISDNDKNNVGNTVWHK